MKITAITPWLVRTSGSYWGEFLFVEVNTDEGITGWGEITTTTKMANRAVAGALRQLNELIVGEDPAQIEAIWHKIFRAFTYMGSRGAACNLISGIDIALWDIRGKVLGATDLRPARRRGATGHPALLPPRPAQFHQPGGRGAGNRRDHRLGAHRVQVRPLPPPRQDERESQRLPRRQDEQEGEEIAAELTALIRETAGPDVEILIDAHGRFDVPTAIRLCRTLEDAGRIDWFEEPVPVESYHALQQVREKVSAAICVGERLHTRWEFVPILEQELADYIMPDVTWTGGISELKKIATMAEAYYIPVSPHDASGPDQRRGRARR